MDNIELLLVKLAAIKSKSNTTYSKIVDLITVMYKYRVLRQLRVIYLNNTADMRLNEYADINSILLSRLSIFQLAQLKENDIVTKTWLYQQQVEIFTEQAGKLDVDRTKLLSVLSQQAVYSFLTKTPHEIIEVLHQIKEYYYCSVVSAWESALADADSFHRRSQSWSDWLIARVKQTKDCFYQFSLIGLGGFMGKCVDDVIAIRGYGKWIGRGLGAATSCYLGWSFLLRSIVTGNITSLAMRKAVMWQHEDKTASVRTLPFAFSLQQLPHTVALSESLVESVVQVNLFPFLKSLAGSMASAISLKLLGCKSPRLMKNIKAPETFKRYMLMRLMLSLIAIQVGRGGVAIVEESYMRLCSDVSLYAAINQFGLHAAFDKRALRRAYYKLSLLNHPDKSSSSVNADTMMNINSAYNCLQQYAW